MLTKICRDPRLCHNCKLLPNRSRIQGYLLISILICIFVVHFEFIRQLADDTNRVTVTTVVKQCGRNRSK